jgi:hypothetical protein
VDLLASDLRMAQSLRTSLALDLSLPAGFLGTAEVLWTREISGFAWTNLNLEGPQGTDRNGRVMYGTIPASGIPSPALKSPYAAVIELRNTSKNYSWQGSLRLERRFAAGFGAIGSYTRSHVRDVQSPSRVNLPGITLWADARALSGRHEDDLLEPSLNDVPHRGVLAITWSAPWRKWTTDLALSWVGESGSPFTYLSTGVGLLRGDLNADGSNANDPIYVPSDAFAPEEIRLASYARPAPGGGSEIVTVEMQATALEDFIERTPCLREQRGRIVARNTCREPWSDITVASLRQGIPLGARALELELDLFNVLNLLNSEWGLYRLANPRLLEHVGQTSGSPSEAQSIFRYDIARAEWDTLAAESVFQLQVALRYRF